MDNKKKKKTTKKKKAKKNKSLACTSSTFLQPGARGDMFITNGIPTINRGPGGK